MLDAEFQPSQIQSNQLNQQTKKKKPQNPIKTLKRTKKNHNKPNSYLPFTIYLLWSHGNFTPGGPIDS